MIQEYKNQIKEKDELIKNLNEKKKEINLDQRNSVTLIENLFDQVIREQNQL